MIKLKAYRWLQCVIFGARSFTKTTEAGVTNILVHKDSNGLISGMLKLDGYTEEWSK